MTANRETSAMNVPRVSRHHKSRLDGVLGKLCYICKNKLIEFSWNYHLFLELIYIYPEFKEYTKEI